MSEEELIEELEKELNRYRDREEDWNLQELSHLHFLLLKMFNHVEHDTLEILKKRKRNLKNYNKGD